MQEPLVVLTDVEAARVLRLTEGRSDTAAVKALNRLVDKGLVRPCLVGKHRRYTMRELERFIEAQVERYAEAR